MTDRPRNLSGVGWLVKSSALIIAGTVAGQFVAYVATVLATRSLGVQQYGYLALIVGLATTLSGVFTAAFSMTLARYCARYEAQGEWGLLKGTLIGVCLAGALTAVLVSGVLYVLAEQVADVYLHEPELSSYVRIILASVPLLSVAGCLLQALRGIGHATDRVILESILRPVARCGIYVAGASLLTLSFLVYAELALSVALLAAAFGVAVVRFRPFWTAKARIDAAELTRFTAPLVPALMSQHLVSALPLMSLGFAGQVGQAGLFAIGLRCAATGSMLLSSLNLNFAPMISAYQGARQMEQLKTVFIQVARIHCLLLSAWVCGVIVFGRDLLALFGPNFTDGYLVVVLLSAALLPVGLTGPVTILMTMTGHASVTLVNSLVNLVMLAALLLVFVSPYGALGAALAAIVTAFLFQGYQAFSAWRIHGFTAVSRANTVLAGVVVAGGCLVAWARGESGLWFPIVGYGLVMLIALGALMSQREREMLRSLLASRRVQASEG